MKQAKIKTIFLITIFSLLCLGLAYAFSVSLIYPVDEWDTSSDNAVDFEWNITSGNSTLDWCAIYDNRTGSFVVAVNDSFSNSSSGITTSIAMNDSRGITRAWNITCAEENGGPIASSGASAFGVDGNTPTVTINSPANGAYVDDNSSNLSFTPVDSSNPMNCSIYTNISSTWTINKTFDSPFISGALYSMNLSKVTDGNYKWNAFCNDTAGNSAWAEAGENRTFTVDTIIPTETNITEPTNNTFSTDRTPQVTWGRPREINFDKYQIVLSRNFDMSDETQLEEVSTQSTLSINMSNLGVDGTYFIQVRTVDLAGHTTNSSAVFRYILDTTTQTVTINAPLNNTFSSSSTVDFNVTILDDTPNQCYLFLSNQTGGNIKINSIISGVTNGSVTNITLEAIPEGTYKFNMGCNDTIGTRVNGSSVDLVVTIDTINPTISNLTATWHGKNNTDLTPSLSWTQSADVNFSKYVASAFYTGNSTLADQVNTSAGGVANTSVTMTLTAGTEYNFSVSAYDLAGNFVSSVNTTVQTRYFLDSVCGILYTGWNLCGAVWTTDKNLSQIGAETNASMVSVWNISSHSWATCNYGSSATGTNCGLVNVSINTYKTPAVWVNVLTDTNWRNRTWESNSGSMNLTLTNQTNGWNIVPGVFRNGRNFRTLGVLFGLGEDSKTYNVTMFSKPYNINGTSAPYVNKGLFATSIRYNSSVLDYGEAMWVYYNNTGTNVLNVGAW